MIAGNEGHPATADFESRFVSAVDDADALVTLRMRQYAAVAIDELRA